MSVGKDFAKENDLQSHLKADWHTVHGIWEKAKPYADNLIVSESWIAVSTFYNSWVNSGGGEGPAGYYKDKLGIVHIRGQVKDGNINASSTGTIFILPSGYRPAYVSYHVTISQGLALGTVMIQTNGEVWAVGGANGWFALDTISFRAA